VIRLIMAIFVAEALFGGTLMSAESKPLVLDSHYWSQVGASDLGDEPLWPTVCELVDWTPGAEESYEQAQLRAAGRMPIGLRYYFLIQSFEGNRGNGGMQAVTLEEDAEGCRQLLQGVAEALRFHGCDAKARVLDRLIKVARDVEPQLQAAIARDAAESELQPLWDRIDAFDDLYEQADEEVDLLERIARHAHAHPDLYVPVSAASAGDAHRFHSPTAGFSITKPVNWRFASMEQVSANRAVARLKDKELEEQVRQRASAPLVVILKHPEPHDDLNPSVQAMIRPLGQLQGRKPIELMELVASTLRQAMKDIEFVQPAQELEIQGLPAAWMKARYTVGNAEGREFKTLSRMWIIPRGAFMFMISASGPQEGKDVSDAEFEAILKSITIER
jgi:hypothetical protein